MSDSTLISSEGVYSIGAALIYPSDISFHGAGGQQLGKLHLDSPMTFDGDADESAAAFLKAVCSKYNDMERQLSELREDKKRLDWVMPVLDGDVSPDAYKRVFALAQAIADGLEGRACIDRAMK